MKRADDFEERRKHIANLSDEELYNRFWEQKIVNGCMDHGLMGKGAGHCVYKLSKIENISIPEAGTKLANGEGWDKVAASFKGGK